MSPSLRSLRFRLAGLACVALVLAACGNDVAEDRDATTPLANADAQQTESSSSDDQQTGAENEQTESSSPDDGDPTRPGADDESSDAEPASLDHAPPPDPAPPVELSPDETLPNAKRLASDIVQELLTYEVDEAPAEVVNRVVGDRAQGLLVTAEPILHDEAWSRGEIVYPQLGGFTDEESSVMVVAQQTIGLPDGSASQETRTFDVRLAIDDGEWVYDTIASVGGRPVERPDDLPDVAVEVLDDERIELPDTARWDIYAGTVRPELLELMSIIAERTEYGVVVFDTGHPQEVFGTDRQSRHSLGNAVDVYRLDGPNVIDDRNEGSDLHNFMQWLYEQQGLTKLGAPWALDGFGGRSFGDTLHQDHLHIESTLRPEQLG
ncbi:hypothetical protein BH23ACT2_BH23ACT2_09590 [soil metagenome]